MEEGVFVVFAGSAMFIWGLAKMMPKFKPLRR